MHMVTELLQTLNLVVLQKIGDKNIVGSGGQFFFGTGCMQHAVHHPFHCTGAKQAGAFQRLFLRICAQRFQKFCAPLTFYLVV